MQILQPICVINCVINHCLWHTSWLRLHGSMSSGASASSLWAWHGAPRTVHVRFEKSFTLITCNLNPEAHLRSRKRRLSSTAKASRIGTWLRRRDGYRKEIKNERKTHGSDSLWAATCHVCVAKCDRWRLSPICFSQFPYYTGPPLDPGMVPFCRGWPLNLSAGTCATQERQRVTSFCRTANPIMDSVCAFAIFGKCQRRR